MSHRLSEKVLRAALAASIDPVIVTDAGGAGLGPSILYVNPAFEALTGYRLREIEGQSPAFLQGPETDQPVIARARQAVRDAVPFHGRVVNYRKDGSRFLNEWRMAPIVDVLGAPTHWIAVLRDVTEQEDRLRRLREVETRFSDLAANIPGAIFRFLVRPDGAQEIEYMSPGCLDLWEVDDAAIEGDPALLWGMVDPEDLPAMQASVEASARTLGQWDHRWRIETPSGARKSLHGRGRPALREDGAILWNTVILDVTDQVETERRLSESREMFYNAQRLDALGKLTGGVAHDFNNLLAVILGNLELAAEMRDGAPRVECLADALKAARRGRDLTRSLLSFARQAALAPESLTLDAVVAEMDGLLRRTLPASIRFETRLIDAPPRVRLDRAALESALLNLVINARDAMPDGGTIRIETGAEGGSGDRAAGFATVAVIDDGPGFDPAILPRATEPFLTTKGRGEGSGLGLSMVSGFVEQSDGALRIDSAPGAGAAVRMRFPVDYAPEAAARGSAAGAAFEVAARDAGARLLLVEDEPGVRKVLAALLRRAGHAVTEAPDAAAAEAAFERDGPFDLVLSDIAMPGPLQGDALARALRRRSPGLPIILMSGHPAESVKMQDPNLADVALLSKPVDRARLIAAVAAALSRRRP
jgi:PAS domain S-box-containing protein